MPKFIIMLSQNSKNGFFENFRNISVKLVVFWKHFYFSRKLMCCVLPFQQFLIIAIAHLFSKLTSLWCDFFFYKIINCIGVVKIYISQIPIIESPIEHDSKILPCTERTIKIGILLLEAILMQMLHYYQLFGKIILQRFYILWLFDYK